MDRFVWLKFYSVEIRLLAISISLASAYQLHLSFIIQGKKAKVLEDQLQETIKLLLQSTMTHLNIYLFVLK